MNRSVRYGTLAAAAVLALAIAPAADDLDMFVQSQMIERRINGLSLAVIQDGKIDARAYGVIERGGAVVTTSTLFQAGSISKPVAALGALRLVEQGLLSLDEDVNARLKSWKVPENEFTQTQKVTLRRLLSHSAGLTVHGFPGYDVTVRMPSTVEVLDGAGNTAAVRVTVVPGSLSRYSGGGYTVMQLLLSDVSGKPFAQFMREEVQLALASDGRCRRTVT
jgi:CubicO group peptidase (beta-lactamase class C family)